MTLPGNRFRPGGLLALSAIRYARRHPWQTWLSFAGIMLGVMTVVAIDLANASARRAFELSLESVSGNITHQIVGGSGGVADSVYTRLRTELGIRRSAPTVSGTVEVDGTTMTLLGLDPVSEISLRRRRAGLSGSGDAVGSFLALIGDRDGVLMSRTSAASMTLTRGDSLTVSPATAGGRRLPAETVRLAAIVDSSEAAATEGLVYADIAVAQRLLDQHGTIDSIDLILDGEQVARVEAWLPQGLALVEAQNRNASLERMSSAFHTNLLAMSLLSLLVAGLLIYNTVTLSVLQREKVLGILRGQGVTRRQVFALVLGEAALLGLAASLAGLALGFQLGQALVETVSSGIPDTRFRTNVTSFLVDPWSFMQGLGLGLGVTLAAAAVPAWQATHCPPVSLQHRAVHDRRWRARLPVLATGGAALMLAGWLLLASGYGDLVGGFAALTLLILGFCLLVPALMATALAIILRLPALPIAVRMALRNVRAGINRTGLAVAALTVAVSVTVGVGVMVSSFRSTVVLWLDQSFRGDIEVTGESLPAGLGERLTGIDGVAEVTATWALTVETQRGRLRLEVSQLPAGRNYYLKEAGAEGIERFNAGTGIFISEPLAYRESLAVGDELRLYTDRGARAFPVAGIFYDYTPSLGLVAMHERMYRQWWDPAPPTRLTVFREASASLDNQVLPAVRNAVAGLEGVAATPNREIRELTLRIFDRTFTITGVLRLLAIIIAFIGILSALMALLLERLREFATLRAGGMTPGQIVVLVLGQTAVMGLAAGLLALPLGLLMSDVLIDVINRRSFGWSMQHTLPLPVLADAVALALGAALIAGIYPALKAARINPAQALREE